MKRLILIFMIAIMSPLYALEITKMSNMNFGEVVRGDRYVKLTNLKVYVEGEPGKKVRIYFPRNYQIEAGELIINVREEVVRLSSDGRGRFTLDCKLNLNKGVGYGIIHQWVPVEVAYK